MGAGGYLGWAPSGWGSSNGLNGQLAEIHLSVIQHSGEWIATEFANLLVERGASARITLNRPEKRNALSLELMEELIRALESVAADAETRSIVVEGAGPVFSAGHDLSEMVGRDAGFYQQLFDVCTVLMETIHRCRSR
jgi:enoyl-CoA hydratase/carnithine racemase